MTTVLVNKIEKDNYVLVPKTDIKGIVTRVDKYARESYVLILDETGTKKSYRLLVTETMEKVRKTKALVGKLEKALYLKKINNVPWIGGHIGSDPEMFVVNADTNEVIPSFAFLKSSKAPDLVEDYLGNHHGEGQPLFWDGFQAEFNAEANACLAWTVDSVYNGLKTLSAKAKAYNPKARLTIQPTLDVPIDMLMESKPEHIEFGCMPSLNAYGMSGVKANGRDVPFRSAGGHIHFGIVDTPKFSKEKAIDYVKALDKILGVACVSLFNKYDDPKRRVLYGLAGEYRLPKHGLEYRTLSSAWMAHSLIMNIVFDLSRKAIGAEANNLMKFWDATEEETIRCINECDVKLARKILKRNEDMFKGLIRSCYMTDERTTFVYNVYMNGMECIIDNPDDVESNWFSGSYRVHSDGNGHNVAHAYTLPKYKKVLEM